MYINGYKWWKPVSLDCFFFRESPKNARGFPAKNELSGSPVDRLTSQSWRPQPSIRPAPAKGHVETLGDRER